MNIESMSMIGLRIKEIVNISINKELIILFGNDTSLHFYDCIMYMDSGVVFKSIIFYNLAQSLLTLSCWRSWAIRSEGKKAVTELGKVLADNPDTSALIEGHTDNDKFAGAMGQIENNWDLSAKRATAIVWILAENKAINKQNHTAAGREEYSPLAK